MIASVMVAAGVAMFGLSAMQLRAHNPQLAQATQPLQSTPGADSRPSAPVEPTTTGTRPSEVPPEPALHGWRLADTRHMRMSGYPGRVRSMSWSAGGKGLATSGADTVIVWPFASKDGPMGKEPAMLAPLQARVSAVACHPKNDILAAGYSDGTILMVRGSDGAEILVRKNGGAQVSALAWNAKGTMLAFADEDGAAGLLTL